MHKVRSVVTTFKRAALDVHRACACTWLAATTRRARVAVVRRRDDGDARARASRVAHPAHAAAARDRRRKCCAFVRGWALHRPGCTPVNDPSARIGQILWPAVRASRGEAGLTWPNHRRRASQPPQA